MKAFACTSLNINELCIFNLVNCVPVCIGHFDILFCKVPHHVPVHISYDVVTTHTHPCQLHVRKYFSYFVLHSFKNVIVLTLGNESI